MISVRQTTTLQADNRINLNPRVFQTDLFSTHRNPEHRDSPVAVAEVPDHEHAWQQVRRRAEVGARLRARPRVRRRRSCFHSPQLAHCKKCKFMSDN